MGLAPQTVRKFVNATGTCEKNSLELTHEPQIYEMADHGDADLIDVRGEGGEALAPHQPPGGAGGQAHQHQDIEGTLLGVARHISGNIGQHLPNHWLVIKRLIPNIDPRRK